MREPIFTSRKAVRRGKSSGRGRFVEAKGNLTIEAAWKRFGVRNGYASQEQLRAAVAEEYGEDSASHVNCNVLTNLEWLAEPFKIDKQFFPPQVEGPKCYADQEIEFVSQVFEQANETSAEFPPLVLVENDVTSEGKYDHWADATGEQYNFPNKYRNMIIEGRRFVYYRGVRRVGSRGVAEYFGCGRIGVVWRGASVPISKPKRNWKWFCTVEDYAEFPNTVASRTQRGYHEDIGTPADGETASVISPTTYIRTFLNSRASVIPFARRHQSVRRPDY